MPPWLTARDEQVEANFVRIVKKRIKHLDVHVHVHTRVHNRKHVTTRQRERQYNEGFLKSGIGAE